jgi:hypothetical protein
MSYLEEFNGIIKKYKNRLSNVKELKFSFIYSRLLNLFLKDLIIYHKELSIHREKGMDEA